MDAQYAPVFTQIQRGIEREALRIDDNAKLSTKPHAEALGSALTHPSITTDYAETLLEFITPVSQDIDELVTYLRDVHRYTLNNIDGEMLWPMSMPCVIANEEDIELAQYGDSNVGKMKTVYREGLRNRYGSLMQIISGLHFNFSLSDQAWPLLQTFFDNQDETADFRSERYFSLIRNFHRLGWVIPYMFGSSPALCGSFLQGDMPYEFEKMGQGTYYLPYGTSLRLSDLGYTNSEQDNLSICYNNIDNYVDSVNQAIATPSLKFAEIGIEQDGVYSQLNSNVLQIENELYAPIRPKRVADSGQTPSQALKAGGVEYIEVRSLDINPFADIGITKDQIRFLDLFLVHCLLWQDKPMSQEQRQEKVDNLNKVILQGRDPALNLMQSGQEVELKAWMAQLFDALTTIAQLFDHHLGGDDYKQCLALFSPMVNDPQATFSGQLMAKLKQDNLDNTPFGIEQAKKFREQLSAGDYQAISYQSLLQQAELSHKQQRDIEQADSISFSQYLEQYFNDARA
ncbi:glutamate--cysteine ligase [Alteromonadales bacterium alter-6D02]|nr:glutamate--cysteine ligase [Alteromonadales bacterium alter-6D02]